jgi:hypothetical protein
MHRIAEIPTSTAAARRWPASPRQRRLLGWTAVAIAFAVVLAALWLGRSPVLGIVIGGLGGLHLAAPPDWAPRRSVRAGRRAPARSAGQRVQLSTATPARCR